LPKRSSQDPWIQKETGKEISNVELWGYEDQIEAGLGVALSVAESKVCKSALIFGVPGNGKSEFPFVLARQLYDRHKINFTLVKVACDFLPLENPNPERLREEIKSLYGSLKAIDGPKILCFDEVDGIVPPADQVNPGWRSLIYFFRACLKTQPDNVLIIGITNHPNQIDRTVERAFYLSIYFPPTCRATVLKMFKERLKLPEWDQVCIGYLDKMAELGYYPQGGTIRRIIDDFAIPFESGKSGSNQVSDTGFMIQGLISHSGVPLTEDDIANYDENNSSLIKASLENTIPYWRDYYRMKYEEKGIVNVNSESVSQLDSSGEQEI